MTIQEIHYQFKINMDGVDSLSNEDYNVAEIDWLLNEARMVFLKRRSDPTSNNKRTGFENSQKRIDDLSTLQIKFPLQPGITPTLIQGIYEVSLDSLLYSYYKLTAQYCVTSINHDCFKEVNLKFVQHDDYRDALKDPFNGPSDEFIPFNYGRSSSGSGVSLYIYPGTFPDNFTVNTVFLEYLKIPRKVNFGGYTYIDGNTYPPTTFDFPEHTHAEIVDIACELAATNIQDPTFLKLKLQKSATDE